MLGGGGGGENIPGGEKAGKAFASDLDAVWELESQKLGKDISGLGDSVNKSTEVGKLLQKFSVFCTCVASLLFASPGSLAAVDAHQRKRVGFVDDAERQ